MRTDNEGQQAHLLEETSGQNGYGTTINFIDLSTDFLDEIANYSLGESPSYSIYYRISKNVFLLLTSGSVSWLYAGPSFIYAKGDLALGYEEAIGTCITTSMAIFNAFKPYIDLLEQQYARKQLQRFFANRSRLKQYCSNFAIVLGSFLSATPITTATLEYSGSMSAAELWFKVIVLQWDNTALHFLPMMLILQKPFFRAPLVPFVKLYELCRNLTLTYEELNQRELIKQTREDQLRLKMNLINTLESARKNILDKSLSFDLSTLSFRIIKSIQYNSNQTSMQLWEEIVKYASLLPSPPSWYSRVCSHSLDLISKAMWGVGCGIVILGGSGYYKNNYEQAQGLTDNPVAIGILTIPTTFVLSVLAGYFGGKAIQGIFDYIASIFRKENEVPLSMKLYPKTTACLLLFAGFFAWFSTGTAEQLVLDSFNEPPWDTIQPFLLNCARYGMQIFGMINLFEVTMYLVKNFALHYGNSDVQAVTALNEKILQLEQTILDLDDNMLEEDLRRRHSGLPNGVSENLQQKPRLALTRLTYDEFFSLTNHEINLRRTREQTSWFDYINPMRFFERPPSNERHQSFQTLDEIEPNQELQL